MSYRRFYHFMLYCDRSELPRRYTDGGPIMLTTTSSEPQSFLTPQEVSHLLRVSVYTVRRWIKEGELPAYKVGRGWRISEADLSLWLGQQRPTSSTMH